MKRSLFTRLLITFTLLVVFSFGAKAQFIKGAAIAGFNLSQVDGDEVYGYKRIGANLGLAAIIPFGENWDLTVEALYSQKGSYDKYRYGVYDLKEIEGELYIYKKYGSYDLRLDYVEIPVLIHYTDKNVIGGGVGISYSQLLSSSQKEFGYDVGTELYGGDYKKNDLSILADFKLRMYKNFWLNARYSYSLSPIKQREFRDNKWEVYKEDQFNNTVTLRLIWIFNDESVNDRIREKKKE